ncbi:Gfo/Idh/MocA family protein [Mangrovibacterium diazotrophicum]|uniref:Putative dehydrogenase n=1 Tax=Mangrovibacterium diazotrophicum TaxID=1261403 RepID=A0A419WBJ5_9BACT|nr:Gfo/Idh/MocA family oxidoreductase [Mangrovibacterium diazotrophicum]RKD92828.1 putative dehydrogenase [Mangrovibacterium diazotrophicum]
MKTENSSFSRRSFIKTATSSLAGITILPSNVIAGLGHRPPSDKLNIAGIGIGGMGYRNLKNMELENIVALCDVDAEYANRNSLREWPLAARYSDYREMFDHQKDIDAVVIATPDHTHALPAMLAMRQGIHVYLQKPLAHSVYESRVLAETAKRYGVATQMGNQGNSGDGIRDICEWIWAGKIGEVTHVDAWTNRPIWPQGLERPSKEMRIPKTLNWDAFIGPAKMRPYNEIYHPWNWRGWWDFGTGALGDMACHILDPVFKALMLEYPDSVQASSTNFTTDSAPNAQTIYYEFPARDNLPKVAMPAVTVNWYDGGLMPPRPDELKEGEEMGDRDGGCIFYGTKGKIMCGTYALNPRLLPTSEMAHFEKPMRQFRRIPDAMTGGHEKDWIRACKESRDNRVEASSNFGYAGPLNEMVMLGVLAVRLQSLGRKLKWEGATMQFTNIMPDDKLSILRKSDFEVIAGDPRFNNQYLELPAQPMAEEWIRHTYRKGWEQI